MPVVVPADSRLAAFLLSNSLSCAASLADFVRLGDDALAKPKAAPLVVASAAAELVFVLSFDTAAGTCEVLPASGASQLNLIAELVSTERVTARPATGGLPAVFKAYAFSLVGDSAGGTFTVNFHREFLSCLNSSRGGFMGQAWDYDVPSVEIWAECLRVLKPGGHLLAFAGTRTQHRMAVRIEDAGFEIRDLIMYCYGSGFPKSTDISRRIDVEEQKRWLDISKALDNLEIATIMEAWKDHSRAASTAGLSFAKSPTAVGISTPESGSVPANVLLQANPESIDAVAVVAELSSI